MDGLGGPVRRFIGLAMIIPPCLSHTHKHIYTHTAERDCQRDREKEWDGWRKGKTDEGRKK